MWFVGKGKTDDLRRRISGVRSFSPYCVADRVADNLMSDTYDYWPPYARLRLKKIAQLWREFRVNRYAYGKPREVPYMEAKSLLVEVEDMLEGLTEAVMMYEEDLEEER